MPISTIITFLQNTEGTWILDSSQADYEFKKELMVERGNLGDRLHIGEDIIWLRSWFELKYPHITLVF